MKVIDLLNKIANGEENDLQTEFVFDGRVWNFFKFNKSEFCLDYWLLNQEIKITKSIGKEDKDIPLIPDDELYELQEENIMLTDEYRIDYNFKVLKEKINQVVEEMNRRNNASSK